MKSISKIILLPILALGVTSCTPKEVSETPINVVDIASAIKRLQQVDNYVIEEVGAEDDPYKAIFNKDYTYNYRDNLGYMNKESGIYPFTIQNEQIVNKEKLSNTTLYGKDGAVISFDDIDTSLIKANASEFSTMKKVIALPLLDICGLDSSCYTKLKKVDIKLKDNDVNKMSIHFSINELGSGGIQEELFIFNINEVNVAKDDAIEKFIKEGTLSFVSDELVEIKDLFEANNYTRIVYDDVSGEFIQGEMFNPSYYVRLYSDSIIKKEPILAAEQVAHLEIFEPDKQLDLLKDPEGNTYPLIYDDVYHFVYDGSYETPGNLQIITRNNPKRPGYAQGAFQEVIKSVEDAWNYPSGLKLFDNLDEFVHVEDGNSFNTLSKSLIDDFLINFNLLNAFDNYGGITELAINHDKVNNEVIFTLFAAKGGYYQIYFADFGKTTFKPFDDLLLAIKDM